MLQTSSVSAFSYFVLLLGGVLLQSCGSERQNGQGNELRHSSSPYLLQHAMNPVDWYPYGEEALALAQKQNKLVIVSVGYASCHWCHVMEEETFEDSLAAAVMNASFVSIKVDREERPDIDDLYMSACQLVSRGALWMAAECVLPARWAAVFCFDLCPEGGLDRRCRAFCAYV
jgi:thiol:disulfide interchange protein